MVSAEPLTPVNHLSHHRSIPFRNLRAPITPKNSVVHLRENYRVFAEEEKMASDKQLRSVRSAFSRCGNTNSDLCGADRGEPTMVHAPCTGNRKTTRRPRLE